MVLLDEADVLVQGYRPGGLDALGLDAADAARQARLVYVSLCAYGQAGPWAARRGFDSLVQTASGFNHAEAQAGGDSAPAPLPAQALDRATGYLMAYAAMVALMRRSREAEAGMCACRWRRPATGRAGSGASRAACKWPCPAWTTSPT